MVWDECTDLASLDRYIAGDGKTYQVPLYMQTEVKYFARGSAGAYTGLKEIRFLVPEAPLWLTESKSITWSCM